MINRMPGMAAEFFPETGEESVEVSGMGQMVTGLGQVEVGRGAFVAGGLAIGLGVGAVSFWLASNWVLRKRLRPREALMGGLVMGISNAIVGAVVGGAYTRAVQLRQGG